MFLLASRGRPEKLERLLEACVSTEMQYPATVFLDECDPKIDDYKSITYPDNFKVIIGERKKPLKLIHEYFLKNQDLDWYGLLADDLVPLSFGWDRLLVGRAGKYKIAYPNDLIQKGDLCTHPVVGGELVRDLGFFLYPGVEHYFADDVLFSIGTFLGLLVYCDDVEIKHVHYIVTGKKDYISDELETSFAADKIKFEEWKNSKETMQKLLRLKRKYEYR